MLAQLKRDSIKLLQEQRRDSIAKVREKKLYEADLKRSAKKRNKIFPLTDEFSGGYRLNSDGWSFFVNRGFIKSESDKPHTSFIWVDISEKKHPKEFKTLNENFIVSYPDELKPISYKYGKINNFYQFKFGYGRMIPLSGKLDKRSVQINWVYGVGISLGLLKPYYLDLFLPEGTGFVRKFDKYTEANKEYFLDLNNRGTIIGGSYFYKGIGETKIQPGLIGRSGFYFDYSTSRKAFLGVEIGASVEVYTRKIPIMINTANNAAFFNLYADFRFGKRWETESIDD